MFSVLRGDASSGGEAAVPGVCRREGRCVVLPVAHILGLAGPFPGAGCAVAALIRFSVAFLSQRWADLTENRSEMRSRLYHVKYKRADYS